MRAVVITVRHSLSVWGASSKKNFTSEPRFGDYASSHVCDEKSSRRTPPSCAAWPHCQWEVASVFAQSQPINGTFGLILRRLHVGYRAARGRWSLSTVLQWRSRWSSKGASGLVWPPGAANFTLFGAAGSASMVAAAVASIWHFLAALDGVMVLCAECAAHDATAVP